MKYLYILYIFLLSNILSAQTPTFNTFGVNNACAFGPGQVYPITLPRIGNFFTFGYYSSGNIIGSNYIVLKELLFGFSNTKWAGRNLPFTSASIQTAYPNIIACGDLLVSIDYSYFIPIYSPQIMLFSTYYIPNTTTLLGLPFYQQLVSFNLSLSNISLEFGVGNRFTIGI